jgi:hypothetical protein
LDGPRLFYVQVADGFGGFTLMLDAGNVSLKGEAIEAQRGNDKGYEFKNVEVKGSNLHALYLKKKSPRNMLDSLHNANRIKHTAVQQKRSAAFAKKDTAEVAAILKTIRRFLLKWIQCLKR